MKLRTEMVDPGFGMSWEALLPDHYDAPLHIWAPAAQHDAMAAHAYKQAVKQVLGYYPESAFPEDGESLDCKSASMARHTCNNIEQRAAEILAGWLVEDQK